MSIAIEVLNAMITDSATKANEIAVRAGRGWSELGAAWGVDLRLRILVEARNAVRQAEMVALELEIEAAGVSAPTQDDAE